MVLFVLVYIVFCYLFDLFVPPFLIVCCLGILFLGNKMIFVGCWEQELK